MDEEPSLLIEDCYTITPEGELQEFPLHTEQRYLFLTVEQVFTILYPSAVVVDKYKEKQKPERSSIPMCCSGVIPSCTEGTSMDNLYSFGIGFDPSCLWYLMSRARGLSFVH